MAARAGGSSYKNTAERRWLAKHKEGGDDMVYCRDCGREMMSREQMSEMRSEIMMGCGSSYEGRMSDYNDADLCSDCMRRQAMRQVEREYAY